MNNGEGSNMRTVLAKGNHSRLARKQLLWILVFSSLVTLCGTCVQLFVDYRHDIAFIEEQFEIIRRTHIDTLARSMYEMAADRVETQLEGILTARDIVAVEVHETFGAVYTRGEVPDNVKIRQVRYDIVFAGLGKREEVGYILLTASYAGVYGRLKQRLFIILTTQAAKTFLVSFFILYAINYLVLRHLQAIAHHAREMPVENLGKQLTLDRKCSLPGGEDELDDVVNAINGMEKRLREEIELLHKTEASLRESEERYRQIFENAVEGFFQSTPEGRFINVNPAFAKMFGYEDAEELLEAITDIRSQFYYCASDGDRFKRAVNKHGEVRNFECQARCKDGSPIWICNNTRCYFNEAGEVVRYEGTVTDIQQRKIAQLEQERLRNQLTRAQKMESIGDLAGGIAHDFNNILSAILGHAELAMLTVDKDSPQESNQTSIRKAGERARDLIRQILTFARQGDEILAPVYVKNVVAEAISFIRSTIPSTIEMRQELHSSWQVMGSMTQINQIVMNLCTNAAHSMADQGGLLEVEVTDITISAEDREAGLEEGDYVRIMVSDNGTGMERDIAERIFEPYFSTKKSGEGTGMGLSIVHGIVDGYGGKIKVETESGRGSSFIIHLPRSQEEENTQETFLPIDSLPRGSEHILFVDDEEAIAGPLAKILGMFGYTVTTATDPDAAFHFVEKSPDLFDLLVTDMNMPGMTGDVLIQRVRQIQPDIGVILTTGFSRKLTDPALTGLALDDCLLKPVTTEMLATSVRSALDRRKSRLQKRFH